MPLTRPVLTTSRLELRPMTPAHLPLLTELDADPEVLRYILGRARTPDEVAAFWGPIAADTTADALGLGFWVGYAGPARDDFVGWWDLEPSGDGVAEAGWRVARRWWRQGLATEGARALLAHGFASVGLTRVFAETMAVNVGSRGVMRRLGMSYVETRRPEWSKPLPGAEEGEVVYEMTAEQWRGSVAD